MKNIITILVLLIGFQLQSQEDGKKLIQFSGVVVSADSLDNVPFTSIIDKSTATGTTTDVNGYFNMISKPGDTLIFKAFGYKSNTYIIPDSLELAQYSIIHLMTPDTLVLPEVDVYPWPSKEQFAKAFVEMDPYEGKMRDLSRKLSRENVAELSNNLPPDYLQTYNWQREQMNTHLYIGTGGGRTPVNNLLNPNAWVKFVDMWKSGELQKE